MGLFEGILKVLACADWISPMAALAEDALGRGENVIIRGDLGQKMAALDRAGIRVRLPTHVNGCWVVTVDKANAAEARRLVR